MTRKKTAAAPPASPAFEALVPGPYLERVPTDASGAPRAEVLPQGVELIRMLAANAHSIKAIAAVVGVNQSTLQEVFKRQPEAREAFEEGRARLEAECAGRLLQHARAGSYAADFFILKTMCGYRETGEARGEGAKVGIQINLPRAMTEEEYARLIRVEAGSGPAA